MNNHPFSNFFSVNLFKNYTELTTALSQCISDKETIVDQYTKIHAFLIRSMLASSETFLLPEVVQCIYAINTEFEHLHYTFQDFEQSIKGSECESSLRHLISGRNVPRGEYSTLFPLQNETLQNIPHIVTAHASPDLDTIVASFWGFVDSFSANIGSSHIWNVPGTIPDTIVEMPLLFYSLFSKDPLSVLGSTRQALDVSLKNKVSNKVAATTAFSSYDSAFIEYDFICLLNEDNECIKAFSINHKLLSVKEVKYVEASHLEVLPTISSDVSLVVVYQNSLFEKREYIGAIPISSTEDHVTASVSLRDFSNREETFVPSSMNVVSVIDHHKMSVSSSNVCVITIADTQSANTLVAEMSLKINGKYKVDYETKSAIDEQIQYWINKNDNPLQLSYLTELFCRKKAVTSSDCYISKRRLIIEYTHYVHAIFDDTDLLSKVSVRDITVMVCLINKLYSLKEEKEVVVLSLSSLDPNSESFARTAAAYILSSHYVYPLYSSMHALKEHIIVAGIKRCCEGNKQPLFEDTKIQAGYARVGQQKLFTSLASNVSDVSTLLMTKWVEEADSIFRKSSDITLHLLLISTINGAEEAFHNKRASFDHSDMMWLYNPDGMNQKSLDFIKKFISNPNMQNKIKQIRWFGTKNKDIEMLCENLDISIDTVNDGNINVLSIEVLPGSINSRKAMVSPFL